MGTEATDIPITVLAIDAATYSGWAVGTFPTIDPLMYGSFKIDGATVGDRLNDFYAHVDRLLLVHKPDFIVLELPFIRGGAPSELLWGLRAIVQLLASRHECGYLGVHNQTVKSHVLRGLKGVEKGTTKERVRECLVEDGYLTDEASRLAGDDACDAVALLITTCQKGLI